MPRVRMDKWLWAARFFKTRSLARRACELGRIACNGQPAKAAREVRAGDLLQVKNESGDYQVEVLALSEMIPHHQVPTGWRMFFQSPNCQLPYMLDHWFCVRPMSAIIIDLTLSLAIKINRRQQNVNVTSIA